MLRLYSTRVADGSGNQRLRGITSHRNRHAADVERNTSAGRAPVFVRGSRFNDTGSEDHRRRKKLISICPARKGGTGSGGCAGEGVSRQQRLTGKLPDKMVTGSAMLSCAGDGSGPLFANAFTTGCFVSPVWSSASHSSKSRNCDPRQSPRWLACTPQAGDPSGMIMRKPMTNLAVQINTGTPCALTKDAAMLFMGFTPRNNDLGPKRAIRFQAGTRFRAVLIPRQSASVRA